MKKLELRQNFNDYERVKKACDEFTKAVIWESMNVPSGTSDEEINSLIGVYQNNNRKHIAEAVLQDATKFFDNYFCRYDVYLRDFDMHGQLNTDNTKCFSTDNLELALQRAATFYRHGTRPSVEIYDSVEKKKIVNWH